MDASQPRGGPSIPIGKGALCRKKNQREGFFLKHPFLKGGCFKKKQNPLASQGKDPKGVPTEEGSF